ncbi:MAG: hypothetical protein ABI862_19600 [Ilumatobacteraceae bacterium]
MNRSQRVILSIALGAATGGRVSRRDRGLAHHQLASPPAPDD